MGHFLASLVASLIPRTVGGEIVEHAQFTHPAGNDRLSLLYVKDSPRWRLRSKNAYRLRRVDGRWIREPAGSSSDFHSLVWERYVQGAWGRYVTITARQFRKSPYMWVADLFSVSPTDGMAIIKVAGETDGTNLSRAVLSAAEEQAKIVGVYGSPQRVHGVQYSWVSWDMRANKRLAVLKECSFPNEPYAG